MGFSRQEYWSGVPLPSPETRRDLDKLGPAGYPGTGEKGSRNFLASPFLFLLCLQPVPPTGWSRYEVILGNILQGSDPLPDRAKQAKS